MLWGVVACVQVLLVTPWVHAVPTARAHGVWVWVAMLQVGSVLTFPGRAHL